MSGYHFHVSCVQCATPLEHTAGGTSNGTETAAVATCPKCSARFIVQVRLALIALGPLDQARRSPRSAPRRAPHEPPRCGTTGGYVAHHRNGSSPCRACKDAHAADQRERRTAARAAAASPLLKSGAN